MAKYYVMNFLYCEVYFTPVLAVLGDTGGVFTICLQVRRFRLEDAVPELKSQPGTPAKRTP